MTAADQRPRTADPASGSRPRQDVSQRWVRVIDAVAERHAAGEPLTVSAIAAITGVPRSWLYQHPNLVDHIHLARRSDIVPAPPTPPSTGAVGSTEDGSSATAEAAELTSGLSPEELTGPIVPSSSRPAGRPTRAWGLPEAAGPGPVGLGRAPSPEPAATTRARSSTVDPAALGGAETDRDAGAQPEALLNGADTFDTSLEGGSPVAGAAALIVASAREKPPAALSVPLTTGFDPDLPSITTWLEGSGVVIPVLGASGGAGASVAAAALFDVCDAAGRTTALVDVADPTRSGLALAGRPSGATRRVGDGVTLTRADRGHRGHLHRLAPTGRAVHAGMVPPAHQWFPEGTGAEVTIVDVGWDPWATLAAPGAGPGSWWASSAELPEELRPCPVLVCSPTRPSVARAQQLMTRLVPWSRTQRVAEVLALIVCGAPRWPAGVAGVAGPEVAEMPTFFLPRHRALSSHGITPEPLPSRVQAGAARLARDWGLV